MQPSTFVRRAWPVFLLAAFALYLYGLGRVPFIGPDEPRYAEVAREMWLRGDLVSPTLGGHLWFEKPVLLYWMMMASFQLFGVSEWTARLGPACAGLMTVLAVLWLGSRVEESRGGREELSGLALSCGAALASSLGLIVFARGASFDVIVTMTITLALCCFFIAETNVNERERRWLLVLFYVFVGASLLAKGLVGIVVPYGVVALYYVLRRAWPERQTLLSLLWGTLLAIAFASVWYAPVIARHGWYFIDQFFIQHHFARYLSNKYHHPQPFYFYAPVMAVLAAPWTLFLAWALVAAPRSNWRAPDIASKLRVFALAWLIAPVLFFSASNSKLPGYVLPALPGAALLVGERLARYLRGDASGLTAMRATGALVLSLAIAAMIAAVHFEYLSTAESLIVVVPMIVAGGAALLWARSRELCVALLVCAMFGTTALALNYASDKVARRESVRYLLEQAAQSGLASAPVIHLHTIERSAEFYATGRLAYDEDGSPTKLESAAQVLDAARRSGGTLLIIAPIEYVNQLTEYASLETRIIGDNGDIALVAVRAL